MVHPSAPTLATRALPRATHTLRTCSCSRAESGAAAPPPRVSDIAPFPHARVRRTGTGMYHVGTRAG